ncbi:MAG: peptidase, partial [Deltaproteobacteria bacterium]|nr:peptidase [Deltaproteobacteria bacterium]
MKTQRKYNWKPDLPDQRDFSFSLKVAPPVRLPTHIDLREKCSEVEDQGHIGSCTGNALAGLIEYLELQEMNQSFEDVSRLFIYYNERILEN